MVVLATGLNGVFAFFCSVVLGGEEIEKQLAWIPFSGGLNWVSVYGKCPGDVGSLGNEEGVFWSCETGR